VRHLPTLLADVTEFSLLRLICKSLEALLQASHPRHYEPFQGVITSRRHKMGLYMQYRYDYERRARFSLAGQRADRDVRTLCMTLAYGGCRLSEALALTATGSISPPACWCSKA
jgi:hypothetical protein